MDSRLNYECARLRMAELHRETPIHGLAREARAAGKGEGQSLWRRFRRTASEPARAGAAVAPAPVAPPLGTEAATPGR